MNEYSLLNIRSVLVVDDEPQNLHVLKQILQDDYHLIFAKDGRTALALCRDKKPDLVLLDVMMPEFSGYEVCAELKTDPVTSNIPVIFISALTDTIDEAHGFEAGAVDYITKPINPAIVKARVATHLSLVRVDELKKSEANLHAMLDNSPFLTWLKDTEGRYIKINKVFSDYIKIEDPKLAIGKTDLDLNPKELAEKYRADDAEVIASRQQKHVEELAFDGKIVHWIETFKTPVIDSHGKVLGTVGFAQDITERKLIETELRISSVAFESQESMLITDPKGIILRVNKAFTESTGYSSEEAIGQRPNLLMSGHHDSDFYSSMWKTILRTDAWQGEIWDRRKNGEVYPVLLTISAVKDIEGNVTHYVGSYFDITERKRAEDQIKHLAFYDHLTLLPNRRLLLDRLHQALTSGGRSGRHGALLFIDLDNFKSLNDTHGHNIGDKLLQQVAKRLELCVREGDTVARLGGDEFVILLEDLSKESLEAAGQAEGIGEKIIVAFNQPFLLDSIEHHNTPSIGATLFRDNSQSIDNLMKQADIAMYQSKKAGRNTLRFFDPQMQETVDARASLEADLRKALVNNELEVFYQPIVEVKSSKILKAEALLRWKHPNRGMISPATFIPLAEESGLILEIGEWVFMQALNTIEHWKNETGQLVQVSVNQSPVQFVRGERHPWLERLANSDLPKASIAVEITEGLLITDSVKVKDELLSFQKQGIDVSIDDFGTGFSALSYLNQFDIDYLKIDISFIKSIVENVSNRALTEGIIAMAHKLGIKTIAEGVETEAQRELLGQFGCDYIQGFLYSKPVTATEFIKLLRN
jgi:diguanylate cyclase (GGDEF)-like protein/PAS domain S-box-containing protein